MYSRLLFICFFLLCSAKCVCAQVDIDSPLVKEWIESEVKKQTEAKGVSTTPGMRVDHYLKSKLFGATVWYSDSDRTVIGRGAVQSIVKRDDEYKVSVYDTLQKSVVSLRVVFEGVFGTGPTAKRRELEIAEEMARKRTYEAEKQLSVSLSPLVNGEGGSSASQLTQFSDPTVQDYPAGEDVLVYDIATAKKKIQEVVIYKGNPVLSDGTPLKIRLERI